MSSIFETGFCFWYWPFFKHQNVETESESFGQHDFGGYLIRDLFVSPRFSNLKEEVLNITNNIEQYQKGMEKAMEHIKTEKCKRMKCEDRRDSLHFDIRSGSAVSLSHIFALISFIDFKEFSRIFVSTFVKINDNEELSSLKTRHSPFVQTAKTLRELVEYFGVNGRDGKKGPFYIPISNVQYVAAFTMNLNKPILATKDINVAKQLSTSNGMLIEINNDSNYYSSMERFFDCSWININNKNDAEYLFFGGRYKLKLQSILMIKSEKKYDEIMSAFNKFDAVLSGQSIRDKMTEKDVVIISSAIKYILGDIIKSNEIFELDGYSKHCFYWFTRQKTKIVLDLPSMNKTKNDLFNQLIMASNNVFKADLFKAFPNLIEIIIDSGGSFRVYPFDLIRLLHEFEVLLHPGSNINILLSFGYLREEEKRYNILIPSNIKKIIDEYQNNISSVSHVIIKAGSNRYGGNRDESTWIRVAFTVQFQQQCISKNLRVSLQMVRDNRGGKIDVLNIARM